MISRKQRMRIRMGGGSLSMYIIYRFSLAGAMREGLLKYSGQMMIGMLAYML